jgi:hypothetical protein
LQKKARDHELALEIKAAIAKNKTLEGVLSGAATEADLPPQPIPQGLTPEQGQLAYTAVNQQLEVALTEERFAGQGELFRAFMSTVFLGAGWPPVEASAASGSAPVAAPSPKVAPVGKALAKAAAAKITADANMEKRKAAEIAGQEFQSDDEE